MKGAWSLVKSSYHTLLAQANIDKSVEKLIDAMAAGSELAKEYAPLNRSYRPEDLVVQDMLREIIKGAHIVRLYCEKRPNSASVIKSRLSPRN